MLRQRRQVGFERLESRCMLSATIAELPTVRVDIPDAFVATADSEFTALVNIDNAQGLRGAEIHLAYDTNLLETDNESLRAGNVWTGDGTEVVANVDDATGTIIVWLFRAEELETAEGTLLTVTFRTTGAAEAGETTRLDLTHVRLNEDLIIVDPAPQPGDDETDGLITFFTRPEIVIQDVEGTGPASFEFIVQLSGPSPQEIRADFATLDGTATVAGGDYEPASGTLVFQPGETLKSIVVQVHANTSEEDKTFTVQLSNLVNVDPGRLVATGTILGEEEPPDTRLGVLSGFVYADTNDNHVPDATEGFPGVHITLVNAAGETIADTWTDQDGWYEFRELPAGSYDLLQRRPAALINGGINELLDIELAAGESLLDLHFRHIGLLPQFVHTRLLAASTQPPGSHPWTTQLSRIEERAQVLAGNTENPAPPPVTQQIERQGAAVVVRGTNNADHFRFQAGTTTHAVTLNDQTEHFPAAEVTSIRFEGGLGTDTAELNGIHADDRAELSPKTAVLRGPDYTVTVTGTEQITVRSTGPGAEARLSDSPADDVLRAERTFARLSADLYTQQVEYMHHVEGFRRVVADSQHGQDRLIRLEELDYVLEHTGSWLLEAP